MNWDVMQGKWNELGGKIKTQWGKLTDDDLKQIEGKKDQLVGRLQQVYGYKKDDAEKRVDDFVKNLN